MPEEATHQIAIEKALAVAEAVYTDVTAIVFRTYEARDDRHVVGLHGEGPNDSRTERCEITVELARDDLTVINILLRFRS